MFLTGFALLLCSTCIRISFSNEMDSTKQCGNWSQEYSTFHRKALEAKDSKFIVAVPHVSGIADRMVGAATVFMMALLSKRVFQIGRREALSNLEVAFDSPHLNWSRSQDPWWVLEPVTHRQKIVNYNSSVIESKEYYALNLLENIRMQDQVLTKDANSLISHPDGDTKTSIVAANKGLLTRYYDNPVHNKQWKAMGLDAYNAFGCIINYLFQPKPEIFAPIKAQYDVMTAPDPKVLKIGIQIRVGDWAWNNANHSVNLNVDFHTYFSCAQQIEDFVMMNSSAYTSVVWFLTTESMPLRRAALEQYGAKLVTAVDIALDHSAKERSVCHSQDCSVSTIAFTTAAAEWWLLGYAEYHVITKNSGYGRSAGFRSLNRDKIYTVHNGRIPMVCDKNSFRPLENHSYDWSGI